MERTRLAVLLLNLYPRKNSFITTYGGQKKNHARLLTFNVNLLLQKILELLFYIKYFSFGRYFQFEARFT